METAAWRVPLALLLLVPPRLLFPHDRTAIDGFSPNRSDSGIHRITLPPDFREDEVTVFCFGYRMAPGGVQGD